MSDMICFIDLNRVAMVKKTKNEKSNEEKLLQKGPTFFAYYPNEPYFYSDRQVPDEELCKASAHNWLISYYYCN